MVDLLRQHSRSETPPDDRSNQAWVASGGRVAKQRSHRLTKAEAVQLVEEYQAGVRILDLATQYRIGRSTVIAHVRRAGVPTYSGWTQETTAEARALYESGLSLTQISERMGRARTTIGNHLREAGVEMRPRGFS